MIFNLRLIQYSLGILGILVSTFMLLVYPHLQLLLSILGLVASVIVIPDIRSDLETAFEFKFSLWLVILISVVALGLIIESLIQFF